MKSLLELDVDRAFAKAKRVLGVEELPAWSKRQILWGRFCNQPGEGGYNDVARHPEARAEFFDWMQDAEETGEGLNWRSFAAYGDWLRRRYQTSGPPDVVEQEEQDRLVPGVMQGDLMRSRMM